MVKDFYTRLSITAIVGKLECPTIISEERLSGNNNALAPTEFGFLLFEFRGGGDPLPESLAHLSLELECFDRPHIYCAHCRKHHIEKFIFVGSWYSVWRTVIRPTLVRAAVA
ncbi:uncharacterized protein C8R40DRAFT_1074960 [Lentinula edodes]|uniref:uncharacterized protein n=1 Tax=Lentinula edodes TaxID=5353 RepID=UPI001E8E8DF6|nr:uncharacterized protein C8R40DRAFT_1074960 [Lentinula edodes]KAH7868269.1 hypothetical protein C8R40DRAFT_1074960 [Lentinula edodes]